MTRIFRCAAVTLTGLLLSHAPALAAPAALAQGYPNKPIRIIVGAGPDILSRLLGQKFTDAWGQQIVIDPRPAAGGAVSAQVAAKSEPDGYTLLMATSAYTINQIMRPGSFDLVRDFAPIAFCATVPYILMVNLSVPARSVKELIALAKAKPGKINFGTSGSGTGAHLTAEMFKVAAGINIVHVPYNGAGPAMVALMGREVEMYTQIPPAALSSVTSGKVRALAVTSRERSQFLPDVPTLAESGLPGFYNIAWNGLLAPVGTPKAIVAKLNGEVMRSLRDPAIRKRFISVGWEPAAENTPEWFGDYIKSELTKWAALVKKTGAKVN